MEVAGILVDPGLRPWVLIGAGVIGLLVGSFLNVVIWRVPRGQSIITPPSCCSSCGHRIRAWENIPVLSWLWLGRHCSRCRSPISGRYPLVELLGGVLFVISVARFDVSFAGLAFCYLAATCLALTFIDLDVNRLPNALVLPAYAVMPLLLGAQSWISGDPWSLARAAIGGAVLYAFYFVAMLVYPGGMGFGDVKLAAVLGFALAWIGWGTLVIGAFSAFLLGGLFSVGLLLAGRARRGTGIPFGPWMVGGAVFGVWVGAPLWEWYLGVIS